MARAKKAPVVKSVIIEGAPVIERAIVRFSHIVLQFTVENGDQISYEVLETLENPEVADAIEYATVRFSEVVCQFVVTDGTTVHAYELEPVYQEIGGGPTPPEPPTIKYEIGSISGSDGTNTENANRLRTDFIPFDASQSNIISVNAKINTSEDTSFICRAYDANKDFLASYEPYGSQGVQSPIVVNPGTYYVSGWSMGNDTEYTMKYGSDVKFIRFVFRNTPNTVTSSITGTVTVNNVEYTLEAA